MGKVVKFSKKKDGDNKPRPTAPAGAGTPAKPQRVKAIARPGTPISNFDPTDISIRHFKNFLLCSELFLNRSQHVFYLRPYFVRKGYYRDDLQQIFLQLSNM